MGCPVMRLFSGNILEVRLYGERVAAGWRGWHNEWEQGGEGIMSGSRVEGMA
jgi:hypothetical protein